MQKLKTFLTVIGAVTILVLAANSAVYAATGGKFILGKTNKAGAVSTLKRTHSGAALNIVTKSSSNAPMTVNGKGKVTNLNADSVDGLDSSALRTSTYSWTSTVTADDFADIHIPLPVGSYVVGYDAYMPGGGTDTGEAGCYFYKDHTGIDTTYFGETRAPTKVTIIPSFSGSAFINVATGDSLNLYCFAPANFTTDSSEPIHIYATRTVAAGGGALARSAQRTARVAP